MTSAEHIQGAWRVVFVSDGETGELAIEVDEVWLFPNGYVLYDNGESRQIVPPHRVLEISLTRA